MHDHLADKRQIILIVRLTVDRQGQLLYGEIIDTEGTVIGRFAEWQRLWATIRTWVVSGQTGKIRKNPGLNSQ
jgi:hypothetical protein